MTFSQQTKNLLSNYPVESDLSAISELSAIIHSAGSLIISSEGITVEIISETSGLSERIGKLIGVFYSKKVDVIGEQKLGKKFYKTVIPSQIALRVLEDCSILEYGADGQRHIKTDIDKHLVMDQDCVRAYIRGIFLGCGYIYIPRPQSQSLGYRMEFVFDNHKLGADFGNLLTQQGFNTKNTLRNSKYVLYLYNSDLICDLLITMGAEKTALDIYSEKANRSVINKANRSFNCTMANIDKAVNAALNQADIISKLDKSIGLGNLPAKLQKAARARLENPFATLSELATSLGISKSGLAHRLNKIEQIYKEIDKRDNNHVFERD